MDLQTNQSLTFTQPLHEPVFSKSGQMKERIGWCTISTGSLIPCPKCQNKVLYVHQKEQYNANSYMCYDCYHK